MFCLSVKIKIWQKRYQLTLEWDQLWFLQVWQNIGCGPTYPYIQLSNPDCIQNQLSHNSLQKIFIQERRLEAGSHFWRACPPSGGRSIGRLPNPAPFEFKPPAPPVNREGAHAAYLQFYLSPWISLQCPTLLKLEDLYWSPPHTLSSSGYYLYRCFMNSWTPIGALYVIIRHFRKHILHNFGPGGSAQSRVFPSLSFSWVKTCSSNLLALRLSSLSSGGVLSLTWLSDLSNVAKVEQALDVKSQVCSINWRRTDADA